MKRFLVLFVALGAALLSIPGVLGFQVQERYQDLIRNIQGGGLQVSSQSYRRGWFGATASTEFYLPLPESSGQAPQGLGRAADQDPEQVRKPHGRSSAAACRSKASSMRWTRRCRTMSLPRSFTNRMPRTRLRMVIASTRPLRTSRPRSIRRA